MGFFSEIAYLLMFSTLDSHESRETVIPLGFKNLGPLSLLPYLLSFLSGFIVSVIP